MARPGFDAIAGLRNRNSFGCRWFAQIDRFQGFFPNLIAGREQVCVGQEALVFDHPLALPEVAKDSTRPNERAREALIHRSRGLERMEQRQPTIVQKIVV